MPGRGYAHEDWDEVSDHPEWTEEDFRNARPFAEVFPNWRRASGAAGGQSEEAGDEGPTPTCGKFRAGGSGWQTRINEALRKAAGF